MTDLSSIRIKKKKSPTVRTRSQTKYKDFIESHSHKKSTKNVSSSIDDNQLSLLLSNQNIIIY